MNQPNNRAAGFTLIELMLAMAFVSVLLITIALTIIQMGTIYNRGMTLKEVNQSARDIADDLRRVVSSSEMFSAPVDSSDDDTADYVKLRSADRSMTYGGRLCTGSYSYIWNAAKAIEENSTQLTTHSKGGSEQPARFLKVPDVGKKYCAKEGSGALALSDVNPADSAEASELLQAGDHSLGIQSFTVSTTNSSVDAATNQRLYRVTYTIGSGKTSAMNADQSACLAPGDPSGNANLTYCNVQKFTLVLRAGNTVN